MSEFAEIDAMKAASEAIGKLQKDEQSRVMTWLNMKFLGSAPDVQSASISGGKQAAPAKAPPKKPATKKAKAVLKQLKDTNLYPEGKASAIDFAKEKSPTNNKHKAVVAVYYLRDFSKVEAISVDHVYTFFKAVSWSVPADLKNILQQAGTESWLDTADSANVILTVTGENVVEHQLPVKK